MKRIENAFRLGVAFMLCTAGCAGTSGEVAPATSEAPAVSPSAIRTETPTAAPTVAPASIATPEPIGLPDQQKIDAAGAAFEADPQPSDLVAWDHLDATANDDIVRLEICSWTGETVFSSVRIVEYIVQSDEAGEVTTQYLFDGSIPGDCLNTELIESALEATRSFDKFWGPVLEDPATFDRDEAALIFEAANLDFSARLAELWVLQGTNWMGHYFDGALPQSSLTDMAWRRHELETGGDRLELVFCRELDPAFGRYRDSVLVDDLKGDGDLGEHVINWYQMARFGDSWLVEGGGTSLWVNCLVPDWLGTVNNLLPELGEWDLLP